MLVTIIYNHVLNFPMKYTFIEYINKIEQRKI